MWLVGLAPRVLLEMRKFAFPFFLNRRQATMVRVVRVSQVRLGSVGLGFRPGSQMTMPRSIKVKLELMSFVTRDAWLKLTVPIVETCCMREFERFTYQRKQFKAETTFFPISATWCESDDPLFCYCCSLPITIATPGRLPLVAKKETKEWLRIYQ